MKGALHQCVSTSSRLLFHAYLGFRYRVWFYMAAMMMGACNAVMVYAAWIVLWFSPFNFAAFVVQISEF